MRDCRAFGLVGRDGFHQPRNGQRIAHASRAADQVHCSSLTSKLNGDAYQRGDARAVDLRNSIQINYYLPATVLHDGLQRLVQLLAGLADGQASADHQQMNAVLLSDGNLHR